MSDDAGLVLWYHWICRQNVENTDQPNERNLNAVAKLFTNGFKRMSSNLSSENVKAI